MAAQQRRLAHASKRDGDSMKTLSLLATLFLPATYFASLFSMTFFNFQNANSGGASSSSSTDASSSGGGGGGGSNGPVVSPLLWIYFVITIPLTLFILAFWRWWDKRRETQYAAEDEDIEAGIDKLEAQIIHTIRQRTLSKTRTFDIGKNA
jgi:Selenoprotein SelK_SelG